MVSYGGTHRNSPGRSGLCGLGQSRLWGVGTSLHCAKLFRTASAPEEVILLGDNNNYDDDAGFLHVAHKHAGRGSTGKILVPAAGKLRVDVSRLEALLATLDEAQAESSELG